MNKYVTTLEALDPEVRLKIEKWPTIKEKFETMRNAEDLYNNAFDRIINFEVSIDEKIREGINLLISDVADKIPHNLQMCLMLEKFRDHEKFEKLNYVHLTLVKQLQTSVQVVGLENVYKLAQTWHTFDHVWKLLDSLESQRTEAATLMTKAENEFNQACSTANLNATAKKLAADMRSAELKNTAEQLKVEATKDSEPVVTEPVVTDSASSEEVLNS